MRRAWDYGSVRLRRLLENVHRDYEDLSDEDKESLHQLLEGLDCAKRSGRPSLRITRSMVGRELGEHLARLQMEIEAARRAAAGRGSEKTGRDRTPPKEVKTSDADGTASDKKDKDPGKDKKKESNSGLTGAKARKILEDTVKSWRGRYDFAANLLRHFLDGKGPTEYIPPDNDIKEVEEHSRFKIWYVLQNAPYSVLDTERLEDQEIRFSGYVRWNAQDDLNLFYAYAGAILELTGTAEYLGRAPLNRKSGLVEFDPFISRHRWRVSLTVKIRDRYTFGPTHVLFEKDRLRLLSKRYKAAHFLEMEGYCSKFEHELSFRKVYEFVFDREFSLRF